MGQRENTFTAIAKTGKGESCLEGGKGEGEAVTQPPWPTPASSATLSLNRLCPWASGPGYAVTWTRVWQGDYVVQALGKFRRFHFSILKCLLVQMWQTNPPAVWGSGDKREAGVGERREKRWLPCSPHLWLLLILKLEVAFNLSLSLASLQNPSDLLSGTWFYSPMDPRSPSKLQAEVTSGPPHVHRTNLKY